MSPSFTLEDYASYILDTPAILINTADGLKEGETRTFGEIYADKIMTKSEVEHACSMFFTDVRLKTYVEIRPADAMPLEDYASYILDTPAILINTADGLKEGETRTFGEIYADKIMTKSEVEHACSMFFTDVRLKTYVEIRPADAMPIPYVIAYAALIKGLFYSETSLSELESIFAGVDENDIAQAKEALMENGYGATVYGTALIKGLFYSETSLSELESIFAGVDENDIAQAKEALMENGYGATVYGKPVAELADRIIEISTRALDDDAELLAPLSDLVSSRTTLARIAEIGR